MFIFNSKIEAPERLEATLVGRDALVDTLEEQVVKAAREKSLFQNLIVGPRGSGKTHILKVLYNRIIRYDDVKKNLVVAYMAEDEVGIDSFLDFLIRIFAAFNRWHENHEKLKWLNDRIEDLKITPDYNRNDMAASILQEFLEGKDLLILLENMNEIFKGLKKTGQEKLRDMIQQHTNVSFIATTQALFNDVRNEDMPFHNFFNITHLRKLDLNGTVELIERLGRYENVKELLSFIKSGEGRGKIRAINDFTQGNHRLVVLFYDFLKTEFKSELSDTFLKTIDKLKPYYESFLKLLAPQQQKIVQYLSLKRVPQTGKEISQNCFIAHNTISKQMSELQRLGYVSAVKKGKERYYELEEPLIRFCFEINEDRRGIIKLFIDFLGHLYSALEIKERYLKYKYLADFKPRDMKLKYDKEVELFDEARKTILGNWCPDADIEKEILSYDNEQERNRCIEKLLNLEENREWGDKINDLIKKSNYQAALEMCEEKLEQDRDNVRAIFYKGYLEFLMQSFKESIETLGRLIDVEPDNYLAFQYLALSNIGLGAIDEAIKSFERAVEIKEDDDRVWLELGYCYSRKDDYDKAINAYNEALKLNPQFAATWYNLGTIYARRKDYKRAIEIFMNSIDIDPEFHQALNNLGRAYFELGEYEKAIEMLEKSVAIESNVNAFNNLGLAYENIDQLEKAVDAYMNAIDLDSNNAEIWENLGFAYSKLKNIDESIEAYEKAIEIDQGNENFYNSLGVCYVMKNDFDNAIEAFKNGLKIERSSELLFNLGNAYRLSNRRDLSISFFEDALILGTDEQFRIICFEFLLLSLFENNNYNEALKKIQEFFPEIESADGFGALNLSMEFLFKNAALSIIKEVLSCIYLSLNKRRVFSYIVVSGVIELLKAHENIEYDKLINIKDILEEFGDENEFAINFINAGIKYFRDKDQNALYNLPKEERDVFQKFVLEDDSDDESQIRLI